MRIELPQIIFQIINFSVVAGALTYLLYKPIKQMLAERSAKIAEAQKAAEQTIAEKKNIDELKKKELKQAEKEAAAIIKEAQADAEKLQKKMMEKAQVAAEAKVEKELASAREELKTMARKLKADFTNQVFAVTEEILGEAVDRKTLEKHMDKTVKLVAEKI